MHAHLRHVELWSRRETNARLQSRGRIVVSRHDPTTFMQEHGAGASPDHFTGMIRRGGLRLLSAETALCPGNLQYIYISATLAEVDGQQVSGPFAWHLAPTTPRRWLQWVKQPEAERSGPRTDRVASATMMGCAGVFARSLDEDPTGVGRGRGGPSASVCLLCAFGFTSSCLTASYPFFVPHVQKEWFRVEV